MSAQLTINALVALVAFEAMVVAFLAMMLSLAVVFPRRLAAMKAWLPKALREDEAVGR
jgi:hypothetical protein